MILGLLAGEGGVRVAGVREAAASALFYSGSPFADTSYFGFSPFLEWQQRESEHFRVIFPRALAAIAPRAHQYLEEAHQVLSPLMRWQPLSPITVVLVDNSDFPNGVTAAALRIGMTLWVTPPENWDQLGFYDDWLRLLIFHEATHFYNLDARAGPWLWLRPLLGDVLLPNSAWPPWLLEGLAVYNETRFTQGGRGRNPYYQAVLRAAVYDGSFGGEGFMTLNRITGSNPYFPGGDTRYQFGYHLVSELARFLQESPTLRAQYRSAEAFFGVLSEQSSGRMPFFINTLLAELVGKNWYELWELFLTHTRSQMSAQIAQLEQEGPVSQVSPILSPEHEVSYDGLSLVESPDGQWWAYTLSSADLRPGLYLKHLPTGVTQRLDAKRQGVGISFFPDSQAFVYSEIRVLDQFRNFSDLRVYSLREGTSYALSEGLRARDPSLSPDGKLITFTLTEAGITRIAWAELLPDPQNQQRVALGELHLAPLEKLYDHSANPIFSPDGETIYFSYHPTGVAAEQLMALDRSRKQVRVLVADGFYNRYPALGPGGELYFVSNQTGVDNLFRYRLATHERVTHLITGLRFPSFNRAGELLASVVTSSGAALSKVSWQRQAKQVRAVAALQPAAPVVEVATAAGGHDSAPAPDPGIAASLSSCDTASSTATSYSPWSTLWPRAWLPVMSFGGLGSAVGAYVLGFDALDVHRYLLAASYEFGIQRPDAVWVYSNRSLAANLTLQGGVLTTFQGRQPSDGVPVGGGDGGGGTQALYYRQFFVSGSASFPQVATYSHWTPLLSVSVHRYGSYQLLSGAGGSQLLGMSPWMPVVVGGVSYSNQELSPLALAPEADRAGSLVLAHYGLERDASWKLVAQNTENFRLAKHLVLSPAARLAWSSFAGESFSFNSAVVQGRTLNLLSPFLGNNVNQLSVRGYPGQLFWGRAAATLAVDCEIPLLRIFQGLGTTPLFADNFYLNVFLEHTLIAGERGGQQGLPAVGAGLRLSTELFYFPVLFGLDYHKGFNRALGGVSDFFFQIQVAALSL